MALNGDLNGVLNNIVHNVSPVIKLSNGLYTLVDKKSIIPDEILGTNLTGEVVEGITADTIINHFKLFGSWRKTTYTYNNVTNTWYGHLLA